MVDLVERLEAKQIKMMAKDDVAKVVQNNDDDDSAIQTLSPSAFLNHVVQLKNQAQLTRLLLIVAKLPDLDRVSTTSCTSLLLTQEMISMCRGIVSQLNRNTILTRNSHNNSNAFVDSKLEYQGAVHNQRLQWLLTRYSDQQLQDTGNLVRFLQHIQIMAPDLIYSLQRLAWTPIPTLTVIPGRNDDGDDINDILYQITFNPQPGDLLTTATLTPLMWSYWATFNQTPLYARRHFLKHNAELLQTCVKQILLSTDNSSSDSNQHGSAIGNVLT